MKNSTTLKSLSFLALIAIGRYTLAKLLSSDKPVPKPKKLNSQERCLIKCPSGNILHIQFDGLPDAQALVFIHGLNSNSNQWFYQYRFFKNKSRLMFIDLPGHGKSAMPKDMSIAVIAEDLAFILAYFKINNPIIYGHSMGAMVVMKYCINHQEAFVKGIVIQHSTYTNVLTTNSLSGILAPLQYGFVVPFLRFAFKNHYLIWVISLLNHLNGVSLIFYRYFYFSGRQTASQINFKIRIAAFTSPKTVALALLELIKLNLIDDLKKIKVPALVLAAYNDRLTNLQANEFISSQISNSQINYVRTGHFSLMESYNEVNRSVHRFIVSLG